VSEKNIRFSTNIITFFDSAFLGLEPDLSHARFAQEFVKNPRHHFDTMLDSAQESGVEGIEFAPDPGGWRAALGVYGSVDGVKAALAERGLVLSSSYAHGRQLIGNAIGNPELEAYADEEFAEHARFLAEFGATTIVSGNLARSRFGNESPDETATPEDFSRPVAREVHEKFADQLNRLGDVIRPYGVRIAIHTDAYSICSRNEDIATVLSLTDPDTVQLCPDAGHITLDGGDAVEVLRAHVDRIPTMHWKDCASPLPGHILRGDQKERHSVMLTYFRILGSGIVDWEEWMRILRDANWAGWAVEEIDNSPDPVGELRQGLEFFRSRLAPIYS
jgi:inosose dehydratase